MFAQGSEADFVRNEHAILRFWKDHSIFKKLCRQNKGGPRWSFIDGPITANNPMGVHHVWGRTYKDAYQRYFAMNGNELRYQNGFDCQGLWVEIEVEKQLGLATKQAIEQFGTGNFVNECKKRVLRCAARQTEQSIRLGYWMDWDDPAQLRVLADAIGSDEPITLTVANGQQVTGLAHSIAAHLGNPEWGGSYFTFSNDNNETIWAFLKKCFERNKLYRGYDVMPWSGHAGCAYSQMEVAEGRRLTTHKSIFVRFQLRDRPDEYLLVWTTTPWTMTSNVAVAVDPDLEYLKVRSTRDHACYYLAKDNLHFQRLSREFNDGFGRPEWKWPSDVPKLKTIGQMFSERGGFEEVGRVKGAEMIGWRYVGPFDELAPQQQAGGFPGHPLLREKCGVSCHRVIDGGRNSRGQPRVVAGEGTGIVHIAPGCGDVDLELGLANDLVAIAPLGEDGCFLDGFGDFTGREAMAPATAELMCKVLREREMLLATEEYPHIYPHCWRTDEELVFRFVDEWFISMDWRDDIKNVVGQIRWLPKSMNGEEREVEWLTNMKDWMISKKRYWGLALPFWVDEWTGEYEVIGSLDELRERAVEGWEHVEHNSPHRPWIDMVRIRNPRTGNFMSRVPDVGNPWLDAGIVPFSTLGYNANRTTWREWYPADFVTECFPGQFRNWFYSMLAMATMLDSSPPFKTVLGHRLVLNEDGQAMHKSDGTAIWFEEAAEQIGVDAMRWMYLAHNPSNDFRFGRRHPDEAVELTTPEGVISQTKEGLPLCAISSSRADDARRNILLPLWNCHKFFMEYASADKFRPNKEPIPVCDRPQMDRWILSDLQSLVKVAHQEFRSFNIAEFCKAVAVFVDDLSNWYIRRNRRRFWRPCEAGDDDKQAAYHTLYEVLVTVAKLLAPCIPFMTERLYQDLVAQWNGSARESVHLCEFPAVNESLLDHELNRRMSDAQVVVTLGHKLRKVAGVRVRQPLSELRCACKDYGRGRAIESLVGVIREELNVKRVYVYENLNEMVTYRCKANFKTLGPRLGKLAGAIGELLKHVDRSLIERLQQGENIEVAIDSDQRVTLWPEDVLVICEAVSDWAFVDENGFQVALSTTITDELACEGIARDFVRQVQELRKEAQLELHERILVFCSGANGSVATAVSEWDSFIRSETLADSIELCDYCPDGAKRVAVGGEDALLWLRVAL